VIPVAFEIVEPALGHFSWVLITNVPGRQQVLAQANGSWRTPGEVQEVVESLQQMVSAAPVVNMYQDARDYSFTVLEDILPLRMGPRGGRAPLRSRPRTVASSPPAARTSAPELRLQELLEGLEALLRSFRTTNRAQTTPTPVTTPAAPGVVPSSTTPASVTAPTAPAPVTTGSTPTTPSSVTTSSARPTTQPTAPTAPTSTASTTSPTTTPAKKPAAKGSPAKEAPAKNAPAKQRQPARVGSRGRSAGAS
jgi:hypothetical protein